MTESMLFTGNTNSYLFNNLKNNLPSSFNFGTGPFTIEWWQKMSDSTDKAPRIFAIGNSNISSCQIGISIEDGIIYYWYNNIFKNFSYPTGKVRDDLYDSWHHFAIVRDNEGQLSMYLDGVALNCTAGGSYFVDYTEYIFTDNLYVGQQTGNPVQSSETYEGLLDSFVWSAGIARYNGNFSVPTSPPVSDSYTQLLLTGNSNDFLNTVVNYNVVSSTDNPYSNVGLEWISYNTTITAPPGYADYYTNVVNFFQDPSSVIRRGNVTSMQIANNDNAFLEFTGNREYLAVQFQGYFYPPATGDYVFNLLRVDGGNDIDDIAMLFLAPPETTIVPSSTYLRSTSPSSESPISLCIIRDEHSTYASSPIHLVAGNNYPILYYFYQGAANYFLSLSFSYNGGSYITDFTNYIFTTPQTPPPPPPPPVTVPTYDPILIKKNKLNQQSGAQVVARRSQQTGSTVLGQYRTQGIYNKAVYAGTNDAYNAWHSATRVRNAGATVPLKAQFNPSSQRVNTFTGQEQSAGSAFTDRKAGLTLDTILPNRGRQNF